MVYEVELYGGPRDGETWALSELCPMLPVTVSRVDDESWPTSNYEIARYQLRWFSVPMLDRWWNYAFYCHDGTSPQGYLPGITFVTRCQRPRFRNYASKKETKFNSPKDYGVNDEPT